MNTARSNLDDDLVARAKAFAIAAHGDQRRKYTGEPYTPHLEAVAVIVASVDHTPEMIAAAWLHDTAEDTATTPDSIRDQFGDAVAALVSDLTNVSKPSDGNRAARRALDRAHLAGASPAAKTIKLADLIDNTKSTRQHDPDFAKVYLAEKAMLMDLLRKGDPVLWRRAGAILLGTRTICHSHPT